MTIFRSNHNKNYTVVNNTVAKDKRLSYKAKGIWLYAFSRPNDWTFNIQDLINSSDDGEKSVRSGLNELEKYGYLVRQRKREKNGQLSTSTWDFFEEPILKEILPNIQKGSLVPVLDEYQSTTCFKPKAEKPSLEKEALLSTELLNTEKELLLNTEKVNPTTESYSSSTVVVSFEKNLQSVTKCNQLKIPECLNSLKLDDPIRIKLTTTYSLQDLELAVKRTLAWSERSNDQAGILTVLKRKDSWHDADKQIPESCYEKLKKLFKNGEFYNNAECFLNTQAIAFQRGMRNECVKLDKFFSWKRLEELCNNFQIQIPRFS